MNGKLLASLSIQSLERVSQRLALTAGTSATQKFLLIRMCPLKLVLFRQPAEFARLAARECPLASTGRACPLGELATVAA